MVNKQLGSSGLRRYDNYVYEEFLPELRWPRAGRIYQEMSDNDPVIGSIIYLAEMLIRGTSWTVTPASTAKADVEAADFLKSCMHDMDTSWSDTISEILSMFIYGFSFHEIVYKVRRGPDESNKNYVSSHTDGRIGWRRLPIRSQHSLHEWEFDKDDDVSAFVQLAVTQSKTVSIPMHRGLLFRTRISRNNPEGRSLLRNAYRPWFFKKHFEEIEGIGIERDLAGFPVLKAPENLDLWNTEDPNMVALKARAEELVASIRRDSEEGVLLPYGWDLSLLSSGSSRQITIGDTIERYDNRIAITMLSDIILLGNKAGSFALADTKQSMLGAALQAQLENIADVFNNKAVKDLFKMNKFEGLTGLPKVTPGKIQSPSLKELALLMRSMNLTIAGDIELMNYLRHVLGMPDMDEELFEEVYKPQGAQKPNNAPVNTKTVAPGTPDDTTEKDLEQNDMNYTGGE